MVVEQRIFCFICKKIMHQHNHNNSIISKSLGLTVFLNIIITLAQAIGGILSGSMALLSDAAHNFSDVISLIISFSANRLKNRQPSIFQTFGFRRSEIVAAFINSATLIVFSVIIVFEAVKRFGQNQQINPYWLISLSLLGIIVNGFSVLLIKKDANDNINIKSAFLHLFSDMLTSIAVLIGGLCILFFKWYWTDAVLSIIIAIYLLFASWKIFKSSLKIIMQFTPINTNIDKIVFEVEKIDKVKNIHHIHLWQINENEIMLEAHIDFYEDFKLSEVEKILIEVKRAIEKYNVNHITLQPELYIDDNKQKISNF